MSADDRLLEYFISGQDVHAETAAGIFGVAVDQVTAEQRSVGKTINFSVIYGQGSFGLAQQLGIEPAIAEEYISKYLSRYPGVARYRKHILELAKKNGEVRTLYGRRRLVPNIASGNGRIRAMAERAAFNTVVQGTAADIMKLGMIAVAKRLSELNARATLLLQVHDELILECHEDEVEDIGNEVTVAMTSVKPPAGEFAVPLRASVTVGHNWGDC